MARSLGIPVLKIASLSRIEHKTGAEVLVDAVNGRLVLEPLEQPETELPIRSAFQRHANLHLPVRIWLNVDDAEQFDSDLLEAASGIGLYRTESLFMKKQQDFPTEQEQMRVYSDLFSRCRGFPVTIRTVDIGGDKQLGHFSLGPQANPYLGLRAHRIYRFHPELFITQFRAILRAAAQMPALRLLFPMIEGLDELLFIEELAQEARQSLKREGCVFQTNYQSGILVEVPSAVWNLPALLPHVDFLSVGTNDLLQYFFAADRNNANVHGSYQPQNPGFLRMLKLIVDTAKEHDKSLMLCGEIAADPGLLALLVGLGFENLSVGIHALPRVSKSLSGLAVDSCRLLAQECLGASTTAEVRKILVGAAPRLGVSESSPLSSGFEAMDPVCGMVVEAKDCPYAFTWSDQQYLFCSKQCLDRFIAERNHSDGLRSENNLRREVMIRGVRSSLQNAGGGEESCRQSGAHGKDLLFLLRGLQASLRKGSS
jgi:phosphoenolpyruvate-protein kinase (PTS system EI component)/YHS domain-containing protein